MPSHCSALPNRRVTRSRRPNSRRAGPPERRRPRRQPEPRRRRPRRRRSSVLDLFALDLTGLGITRVGDHTDLDVLGIPVWFASRPNSRGLSVSQGKGLTHAQARLSAGMEAVETAYAERCETLVRGRASLDELEAGGGTAVPFARLLRCASEEIDREQPRFWVEGRMCVSGETVYAPFE